MAVTLKRSRAALTAGTVTDLEESMKAGYPRTPRRPILDRFMEKWELDESTGCWLWTAALRDPNGYACIGAGGKPAPVLVAHRWSYEHFVGPIPEGMQIDHICHVKRCVNPEHLRVVTGKQNVENVSLRSDNKTGFKGVSWHAKERKYRATIRHHGVLHYLGAYDTAEEAGAVAKAARLELFTHNDPDRTEP